MGAALLITFREMIEATLVIGILIAWIRRSGQPRLLPALWAGAVAGLGLSALAALLFVRLTGAFDGQAEQIFEGSVMLAAAVLLTTLILWLNKGESRQAIEARAGAQAASATPWLGIFLLVLTAVLREGVEAVLFLSGILRDAGVAGLAGALGGLVLAAATGWLLFIGGKKLPIRGFFTATNLLLVLFAAGMVSLALGEFHEAGLVPPLVEHVWDLNPPVADGAYPWWHDHGAVGDFLRGLFGYTADPSLVQILAWLAYLVLAGGFVLAARRRKPAGAGKAAG